MSRRDALKAYFVEVARDLVARGAIRHTQGQPIENILRTEPRAVLQIVQADLIAVSAEIGVGLVGGLGVMLQGAGHPLAGVINAGGVALGEWLAKRRK